MASLFRNAVLLLLLAWQGAALAQPAGGDTPSPLRFGILPLGGAVESREPWTPLRASMSAALGRPVAALSVTSYELLDQAIRRNEVDIAFLSAQMALDAVTQRR
ncbi:MAG: PhnD/SsuA/transferrin family substrate-binding protein, partial [Variovorax sp.]